MFWLVKEIIDAMKLLGEWHAREAGQQEPGSE
jgi:hypothetical protein